MIFIFVKDGLYIGKKLFMGVAQQDHKITRSRDHEIKQEQHSLLRASKL